MNVFQPDGILGIAIDGYDYISRRCDRRGTDVFQTRILGVPVICTRGAEAGRLFYDSTRFARAGVAPRRARRTLFGDGGVQGLDGTDHRHRKAMFLSLMTSEAVTDLAERTRDGWHAAIERWAVSSDPVVLLDEVARILCRAVCDWAGVPLAEHEVGRRTAQLHQLIDSPARFGPAHWRGRIARIQADKWASSLVTGVRNASVDAPEGRALHTIATHRNQNGDYLDVGVAAVELINVLRPTVAIDRFIVFGAAALHSHPGWRDRLRNDDEAVEWFVQEVRRVSPFFPVTAARVRSSFEWGGVRFPEGRLVLFDRYGTHRHPNLWPDPASFRPERFQAWDGDAFSLVPQGGGEHAAGHRCPGEWITIATMKVAIEILTRTIDYAVPPQDLRISHRRVPTMPNSGFVISDVTRRDPA